MTFDEWWSKNRDAMLQITWPKTMAQEVWEACEKECTKDIKYGRMCHCGHNESSHYKHYHCTISKCICTKFSKTVYEKPKTRYY